MNTTNKRYSTRHDGDLDSESPSPTHHLVPASPEYTHLSDDCSANHLAGFQDASSSQGLHVRKLDSTTYFESPLQSDSDPCPPKLTDEAPNDPQTRRKEIPSSRDFSHHQLSRDGKMAVAKLLENLILAEKEVSSRKERTQTTSVDKKLDFFQYRRNYWNCPNSPPTEKQIPPQKV